MCICCCNTRKSLLIYMMIISVIAAVYGIIVLTQFASKTDIYDNFIKRLKYVEEEEVGEEAYESLDENATVEQLIGAFGDPQIKDKSVSLIKNLKNIENGMGIVLFIFPLIFLIIEVVFLILMLGNKEYKPTLYKILNIIRIVCIVLSIILILLSILYIVFLAMAFVQFFFIVPAITIHEFLARIIIGIVFGIYLFWFYITLSCAFCKERNLFKSVGPNANGANGNQFSEGVKPEGAQVYSDARVMN